VSTSVCEGRADWLGLLDAEFGLRLDAPDDAVDDLWRLVEAHHAAWLEAQDAPSGT
jgi:hypothetical protein